MDNRTVRLLIYIFSGLIALFTLLMLANFLGTLGGERPGKAEVREQEEEDPRAMAQQALAASRATARGGSQYIPYNTALSSGAEVAGEGGIRVVKDSDFNGVAEKPKGMMDMLNDMGGGRKKPAPVKLDDSDLDRKMRKIGEDPAEQKLKAAAMPELGRGAAQEGVTLLAAPVDFKVFKSSETWWAFANSRKYRIESLPVPRGDQSASALSNINFARESVVVLVSVSDLPNGIFKAVKLDRLGSKLLVWYKVDPLAMAVGNEDAGHDYYSAVIVPKTASVTLRQQP